MKTDSPSIARSPVISSLGLICAAQFVLQLDFSIVNVALPTIQRELGFAPADLQWVVSGYALTFGSLLLLGGRAGDLLGRRRLLVLGLVLFGLASLTCGLALSPLMLILSRFVQGAGAAFVSPSALSLLTTTNAEGAARNRALSIFQASTAAGASTGVIAGGVLTQYLGWRVVFLVNLPIIAVLLLLIPRVLPDDTSTARQRLDVPGAALVTASAAALIYGLSSGQQQGFASPGTVLALVAAVLLAVVFVLVERTTAAPLVPFSYFSSPTHRAAGGGPGCLRLLHLAVSAVGAWGERPAHRPRPASSHRSHCPDIDPRHAAPARSSGRQAHVAPRADLDGPWPVRVFLYEEWGQLPRQRVARTAADLSGHRPGPAERLHWGDSGRRSRRAGTGRGLTDHQPAGRCGCWTGPAGHARCGSYRADRFACCGLLVSYLVAIGLVLIAMMLVATQLNHQACQSELTRQRREAAQDRADALLQKD
jgi:MFS family permease